VTETSQAQVLIIEDTLSMALTYKRYLERAAIPVELAQTGASAIEFLSTGTFTTALLDLQLPDMNGLEIIKAMQEKKIPVTFIVLTANGSVNVAVEAMQKGAYDFLIKPVAADRLITSVKNGLERTVLQTTVAVLKEDLKPKKLNGFIGNSAPMLAVYRMIESVSHSKAPVFITGESGTGKEVCAQAIHDIGDRSKKPFVAINCAAIPENLIESEIFGHVKGAFTGAAEARKGAAAQAHGGTLFLDEICEMDIGLQAKLLRFLQTGKVKRVGSDWLEDVDVRIICATNRNPVEEVAEKRFREDLFYRLDVLSVNLPPLRDRGEDILELAESFMLTYAREEGKNFSSISDDASNQMLAHSWPGNIREVQNMIRKIVVVNDGPSIESSMLSFGASAPVQSDSYQMIGEIKSSNSSSLSKPYTIDITKPYDAIEREIIEAVIASCDGSIPKASKLLNLSPSTIYRKKEGWEKLSITE